jgi:Putative zinc-finger
MNSCDFDVVLYFYDEMDPEDRARATAHLRVCGSCRQRLEDLHAIRRALAERPAVDGPPAGDWSGFMRRLDEAVGVARPLQQASRPAVLEHDGKRWSVRHLVPLAAVLALVTIGVFMAARFRSFDASDRAVTAASSPVTTANTTVPATSAAPQAPDRALREVTAEHLERSKLVVLGLATRDPDHTTADDWQYERKLAETLLTDTRLYRLAAQDRGVSDVARVMRDLETVLLEASLSDTSDRNALGRVQRLINKRDLVVKMQVVAGSAGL